MKIAFIEIQSPLNQWKGFCLYATHSTYFIHLLSHSNASQHIPLTWKAKSIQISFLNLSVGASMKPYVHIYKGSLFHKTWMVIYLCAFFTVHQFQKVPRVNCCWELKACQSKAKLILNFKGFLLFFFPITIKYRLKYNDDVECNEKGVGYYKMGRKQCLITVSMSDWSFSFCLICHSLVLFKGMATM